ncbi:hypothetical protein TrRE_jg4940, partial [Triparma retinervis]
QITIQRLDDAYGDTGFSKEHLLVLMEQLNVPTTYTHRGRHFRGEHSLISLLYLLRKSNASQDELSRRFGGSSCGYTHVIDYMMGLILPWARKLEHPFAVEIWSECFQTFTDRIQKVASANGYDFDRGHFGCVGFIDGSIYETKTPQATTLRLAAAGFVPGNGRLESAFYTGHAKLHGMKKQAVVGPNGCFMSVQARQSANNNDLGSYNNSGLHESMSELCRDDHDGKNYYFYGDGIYRCIGLRAHVRGPFKTHGNVHPGQAHELEDRKAQNKAMGACRVAVENAFAGLKGQFQHLANWKNHSLLTNDGYNRFADKVLVAALLYNLRNLLSGNQISQQFGYTQDQLPTVHEYLDCLLSIQE